MKTYLHPGRILFWLLLLTALLWACPRTKIAWGAEKTTKSWEWFYCVQECPQNSTAKRGGVISRVCNGTDEINTKSIGGKNNTYKYKNINCSKYDVSCMGSNCHTTNYPKYSRDKQKKKDLCNGTDTTNNTEYNK